MNDAISQHVDAEALDEGRRARIYCLSVGSGGFKASHEAVDLWYRPDTDGAEFVVRAITPVSVTELFETEELSAAIQRLQEEAESRLRSPTLARAPSEIPDTPSELTGRT